MVFKNNIWVALIYFIWCAVGFVLAILLMVVTVEKTYTNEFLDEQKKEWMKCGESMGIVEGISGKLFDEKTVFKICKGIIEPIICEDCEKI